MTLAKRAFCSCGGSDKVLPAKKAARMKVVICMAVWWSDSESSDIEDKFARRGVDSKAKPTSVFFIDTDLRLNGLTEQT